MPSELKAEESGCSGKFLRMGGMVVKGSLQKDLQNLTYRFELTDGGTSFPVFFKGVPPDLFIEGKGAVVEGRIGNDGVFQATTIMAKHAEDYSPHADGKPAIEKFRSRQGSQRQVTASIGHSSIVIAFSRRCAGIVSPILAARSARRSLFARSRATPSSANLSW